MNWQATPLALPFFLATGVSAALALYAWRRRPAPGALPFVGLMLAVATWSLGYALELAGADLAIKLVWAKAQYLGIVSVPVAWLVFALQYTGRSPWLKRRGLLLLMIVPLVTLTLVWTNDVHHLIWSSTNLHPRGAFSILALSYGPMFWVFAAYTYVALLLGSFLLLLALFYAPRLVRRQVTALLIAVLAPCAANLLYLSDLNPLDHLELTPLAFTLSGLAIAWGLFRLRLLDVVPVARDAVIESMGEGVIALDGQGCIADLNPAAERLLGCTTAKIVGQPAHLALTALPALAQRCRDLATTQEEITVGEGEAQRRLVSSVSPLRDRRGRLMGHLVVLRDITERKQAAIEQDATLAALEESEEKYRRLFELESDAIFLIDNRNGQILETNTAASAMYGYSREELLNKRNADLSAEPQETQRVTRTTPVEVDQVVSVPLRFHRKKDGTVFPVEITGRFFTWRGRPAHIAAIRDISARREAEEQLRQLKEFNEGIVQNMAEGIVMQDAAGTVTFVNPTAASLLGYTPEELVGRHWMDVIPPDQQPILRSAEERRRRGQAGRYELELVRKDGTRLPVLISGSPRFDATTGRFAGTLAVFADIGDRVQAEDALRRRTGQLEALRQVGLEIASQLDLDALLQSILIRATELLGGAVGGLYLYRPGEDRLRVAADVGLASSLAGTALGPGEGLAGRVWQSGEPLIVDDYRSWDGRAVVYDSHNFRATVGVPIRWGDQFLGVLTVTANEPGVFSSSDAELLSLFASQSAIALQNARLFHESQQQLMELTLLFEASVAISSSLNADAVLQAAARQITAALAVDGCAISVWNREQDALVTLLDYAPDPDWWEPEAPGTLYPLAGHPASRWVLTERRPLVVQANDPEADAAEVAWMKAQEVCSLLMVPLVVRDKAVGLLELMDVDEPRKFTASEIRLCQTLASQAAATLENARLFEAEHEQRQMAEVLREAAQVMGASLDLNEILRLILEQLKRVLVYETASVLILRDGYTPDLVAGIGFQDEGMTSREAGKLLGDSPILRRMARDLQPVLSADVRHLEGWIWVPGAEHVRSWLAVPLAIHGRMIGALMVDHSEPGSFGAREVQVAQTLARHAAQAIDNARLFEETRRRNRELALLNRVIAASAASQEIETILEVVCRELAQALEVSHAAAALLDQGKTEAVVVAEHRADGHPSALGQAVPVSGIPLAQDLFRHKAPLVVDDASADPRLGPVCDLIDPDNTICLLILPLVVEGEVMGSLGVAHVGPRRQASPSGHSFSPEEVDLAWRVARQVAGALARARLAETERRLSAAVEQAAEAVIVTDAEGTIVYVNPAFEQILGYSRAEIIGRKPSIFGSDSRDTGGHQQMWQTVTAGRVWQERFDYTRRDGSSCTLDMTAAPVLDRTGEIVNYVATLRDVTREVQLERQFQQAQKMEALGRLAGGVAHDFNNLLTVIQISTQMLQRKLHHEDPLLEHVRHIRETGERAIRLTRQLLSFSRREVIQPRVLNLNLVVGELSRMLQRILGEDVRLTTALADGLWPVLVDPSQIDQVVVNLAVNARDAMPGGGSLTIETANVFLDEAYAAFHVEAQPGEYVMLSVSDTGTGMDEAVKARIFEPFFTTKERGQGVGLGLATVFGIAKQNGGHVDVYSEVGRGTTFKVYLPRSRETETLPETPSRTLPPIVSRSVRGTETVLLVEDDARVRELAARVLESCGYRVLAAGDGLEALQIGLVQQKDPIHLLLTDVVLPQMSGPELAEQLQSVRPEMRVLYMSGYTDNAIVRHGTLAPGIAFLPKPFTIDDLTERVREVLDAEV